MVDRLHFQEGVVPLWVLHGLREDHMWMLPRLFVLLERMEASVTLGRAVPPDEALAAVGLEPLRGAVRGFAGTVAVAVRPGLQKRIGVEFEFRTSLNFRTFTVP